MRSTKCVRHYIWFIVIHFYKEEINCNHAVKKTKEKQTVNSIKYKL